MENQITKKNFIGFVITLIFSIAIFSLFIFQVSHLIVTIWNIIPIGLTIFILVSTFKTTFLNNGKKTKINNITQSTDTLSKKLNPNTASKKLIFIESIFFVITISLSILFFILYAKKTSNLTTVNAEIFSQNGEIITTTTYDEIEDETVTTETRYCELTIFYNYKGFLHFEDITLNNTSKVFSKTIKIYINSNGDYINTFGKIQAFKIEGIIFLTFSILILLSILFKHPTQFFVILAFGFISLALLVLANASCFEDFLYNDITTFISLFVLIGIVGYISLMIERIIIKKEPQTYPNSPPEEKSVEDVMSETKKRLVKYRCKYCGAPFENYYSTKCKSCGAPNQPN